MTLLSARGRDPRFLKQGLWRRGRYLAVQIIHPIAIGKRQPAPGGGCAGPDAAGESSEGDDQADWRSWRAWRSRSFMV
ncbi:MAG TPA: hypothetical protein VM759_08505, partial [Longimicrobium sp.]|nr:hypothetical protein [Longimicrobium sp.]